MSFCTEDEDYVNTDIAEVLQSIKEQIKAGKFTKPWRPQGMVTTSEERSTNQLKSELSKFQPRWSDTWDEPY